MGLRVRSVFDALAAQGIGKEMHDTVAELISRSPLAGFDPTQDLDEVLLATTGEGQNPPTLVVMTGRFNVSAFQSAGVRYRNALTIERPPGSRQLEALIDSNTMLAGEASMVRAALDRGSQDARIDPALAMRVGQLRARYDLWGAGRPEPGLRLPAGTPDQLGSIDRFEFGVAVTRGLDCFADLHARTPQDLEKLSSTFKLLEAMFKAQPAGASDARFDLRVENGGIHASLSMPEEALKKAVAAQRASFAAAAAARTRAGVAPATTTAPPAPRKPPGKPEIIRNSSGEMVVVKLP